MIKFFRKIRQKLTGEGDLKKYLLYAIGEIVLVVIGILIAISINNWNEKSKELKEVNNVLIEIKDDLLQDRVQLELCLEGQSKDSDAQDRVIKALETKAPFNEELRTDFGHIFLARTFYSVSKGYALLKEMNAAALIDKDLRISLTQYYEKLIPQVYREFEDDEMEFETYFLPRARVDFKEWEFGAYGVPRDYTMLVEDEEFITAIKMNCTNLEGTIRTLTAALEFADELIIQLPSE